MRIFRFAVWALLSFYPICAEAQKEVDIEALAEELFAVQDEEMDYDQLYENLLQRLLNPVDINTCTPDELQSLYILHPLQLQEFFKYRQTFGNFLSTYELQAIPSFDVLTIKKLLPFITIDKEVTSHAQNLPKRLLREKTAYLIYRIRSNVEMRKGFTPPDTLSNGNLTSRYAGGPSAHYVRFRTQHTGDFSAGFTLDKDAGEPFSWKSAEKLYGFDFVSYHFTVYNKGNWKTITAGDYQAQFGQGMVFGAGFSVGKGAETITTTRRSSTGIRPYTSSMESGYFRGLAATYEKGRIAVSLLASATSRDGNRQISETDSSQYYSSLSESGYHRTPSEMNNRKAAKEKNLGANANYTSRKGNFQLGLNGLLSQFDLPLRRSPQPYNSFEFGGKTNSVQSLYFSYNFQNHFLFGEGAMSSSKGKAYVLGLMSSLSKQVDMVLHIRNFDRDFHSFYGNAFGEGSRPINEQGIYLGLNFHPNKRFRWSGYYDQFRFPWLRYRLYAPSEGHEWLQRITYSPKKHLSIYFQLREEVKERNISTGENLLPTYQIATGTKRNYIINLDHQLGENFSLRSRIQWSTFDYNAKKTNGYTIVQDFNVDHRKWKWSARFALFDTEDYDNRQYVFEKNVLWAFSIPSYYGQGMRYYLLTQYQPNRKLTFWLRWSRTTYTDRDIIGSGLQEVQGNRLSELTFQARYQFNR